MGDAVALNADRWVAEQHVVSRELAEEGAVALAQIRQGTEIGRPSVLYAAVAGEGDRIDSVEVGGTALIVAEGLFRITPG